MRNFSLLFLATVLLIHCTQPDKSPSDTTSTNSSGVHFAKSAQTLDITGTETNVVSLSVGCGYENQPCVSVTICPVGSSSGCVVVNNLLLDTGSSGLRIFKSALNGLDASLSSYTTSGGNPMAECVHYGDGTSHWGPLKKADVTIGQKQAPNVAIQVINTAYNTVPPSLSYCSTANADKQITGYNGILGISPNKYDCGTYCTSSAAKTYYSCPGDINCSAMGASISGTTNLQLMNPIFAFSDDNNGVVLQFPALNSATGAASLNGYLVFGIDTQTNNIPQNATLIKADSLGFIYTTLGGSKLDAFIDSGSEALFLPTGTLATCGSSAFLCPSSLTSLSGTITSIDNLTSIGVNFSVANTDSLPGSNRVFDNLGVDISSTSMMMWGFPFFIGNTVFVGYEGKTSILDSSGNPYWAF